MSAPVRVLHVAQPTDYGVARYLGDLAAGQVAAGCPSPSPARPTDRSRRRVRDRGARHVPWEARREPGPHLGAEVRRLRQVVATERPDVVHLHSSKAGLAGRVRDPAHRPDDLPTPRLVVPRRAAAHARPGGPLGAARRAVVRRRRLREPGGAASGACSVGIDAPWHVVPNAIDVGRFDLAGPTERRSARRQLGLGDAPSSSASAGCAGRRARTSCSTRGRPSCGSCRPRTGARRRRTRPADDRAARRRRRAPRRSSTTTCGRGCGGRRGRPAVALRDAWPSRCSRRWRRAQRRGHRHRGAREALGPRGGVVAGALVTPEDPARPGRQPRPAARSIRSWPTHEGLAGRQRVERTHHRQAVTAGVEPCRR